MRSFHLESKLNVTEIISASVVEAKTTVNPSSENYQMLYILSGRLNVTIGTKVYFASEGDAVLLVPGEFSCICPLSDASYIEVSFNASGYPITEQKGSVYTLEENDSVYAFKEIIEKVYNTLSCQELYTLLELLIISCYKKGESSNYCAEKDAPIFSKAAEILENNISSQVSVPMLADRLSVSVSHLKRIFARYAVIGVHEYYTALKISYAKELLRSGESVTKTAELTGFSNQAYFSAAFKKVTGSSPKELSSAPQTKTSKKTRRPQRKDAMPSYLL